jgi:hypothetical protein
MSVEITDISRKGIIERLRDYFTKYPQSSPRAACAALRLDPKEYAATARVVKCRLKRMQPYDFVNVFPGPFAIAEREG